MMSTINKKNLYPSLAAISTLLLSPLSHAGFIDYFKYADGSTNWQYIANFSSSVLIVLLSIVLIKLFLSQRRIHKANQELRDIRDKLEQRVKERTATLDESNSLLTKTNNLLADEVAEHKNTSSRLLESEAYISNILTSMPLALIGLNENNKITHWNQAAESLTGISGNRALDNNLWETYPTITISADQITQVSKSREPLTIKHSQRGRHYYDITVYPLAGVEQSNVVILIDNVTQRIQVENMLIQRDKMAAMGELAATMAYDVSNPIAAIVDKLQKLSDQPAVEQQSVLLSDAIERSQQVSSVVNNLLEFANNQGHKHKPTDIPELMDRTLELAANVLSDQSGLRFKDIHIEKLYADGLPKPQANPAELQQVILSLLRHTCHSLAITERDNFEPNIRIEISEFYSALWIKVQHNGKGLTIEEQQYIFEPFFNKQTQSKQEEVANRLSFAYFIITEHHKGQMAITSDIDVGSTFHIQLELEN